jgi:hypothetical protein
VTRYRLNIESVARVGGFVAMLSVFFILMGTTPEDSVPPWWAIAPMIVLFLMSVIYLSGGNAGMKYFGDCLAKFFLIKIEPADEISEIDEDRCKGREVPD